ncbi:MAG TPA: hypothetical protein VE035_10425 [Puia sp.]|nr:hypothetical protein [Puia sp.]
MKKILVLATAAFLVSGVSFAYNGGDKGKEKGKKSCTKSCPGKQCGKQCGKKTTAKA